MLGILVRAIVNSLYKKISNLDFVQDIAENKFLIRFAHCSYYAVRAQRLACEINSSGVHWYDDA